MHSNINIFGKTADMDVETIISPFSGALRAARLSLIPSDGDIAVSVLIPEVFPRKDYFYGNY